MTWHIPTLAELPRAAWPVELLIEQRDGVERVRCGCSVPHPARDIFELRAAPASFALPPFLCTHCLHHAALRGRFAWRALVAALGCTDATVLASHDAVDAANALATSRPPAGA